jgi:TetR/AcrR family transcriptional repressor of mexJK operon
MTEIRAEPGEGRSARKRRAIRDAGLEVFLSKGYERATMDDIASRAVVSKQTVYKQFADKEQLFSEIVLGTTTDIGALVTLVTNTLATTTDLRGDLQRLAESFLTAMVQPEVLRLRRLVISCADRFPAVGATWYEEGFERVVAALAGAFRELDDLGLLRVEDAEIAAHHFVGMLLWIPINKAMFTGDDTAPPQQRTSHYATAATRAFLDAYGGPRLER